jgi:predicted RNA-binding Zn-ribbon protein involved in translation (DUF1610 family)
MNQLNYMQIATCDKCRKQFNGDGWTIEQKETCPKHLQFQTKHRLHLCEKCGNKMFRPLLKKKEQAKLIKERGLIQAFFDSLLTFLTTKGVFSLNFSLLITFLNDLI